MYFRFTLLIYVFYLVIYFCIAPHWNVKISYEDQNINIKNPTNEMTFMQLIDKGRLSRTYVHKMLKYFVLYSIKNI